MCQQVVEPVVRHADVCQVQYRYTVVQFACSRKKQYMDIQSDVRRRAAEREGGREREREGGREGGREEGERGREDERGGRERERKSVV